MSGGYEELDRDLNTPELPPPFTGRERAAIVTSHRTTLREVAAYLPANYEVYEEIVERTIGNVLIEGYHQSVRLIIRGRDVGGWTLDGYVLPRLASGLIGAEEVDV